MRDGNPSTAWFEVSGSDTTNWRRASSWCGSSWATLHPFEVALFPPAYVDRDVREQWTEIRHRNAGPRDAGAHGCELAVLAPTDLC